LPHSYLHSFPTRRSSDLNERLAAAEALATRLREERTEMERRETTLQQQVLSLGDETAGLAKQSEELTQQLDGLRAEKLRLEVRQDRKSTRLNSSLVAISY